MVAAVPVVLKNLRCHQGSRRQGRQQAGRKVTHVKPCGAKMDGENFDRFTAIGIRQNFWEPKIVSDDQTICFPPEQH